MLLICGVKGAHPAESTKLHCGSGFPLVVKSTVMESLRQSYLEETRSFMVTVVLSSVMV